MTKNNIPFLQEVAAELHQKYGTKISDIQVVLPSRRSCMYFRHYLMEQVDGVLISPEILSMSDFISQLADTEVSNPVSLLFDLYTCFKKFDSDETHTLEKFAPLGSSILSDFSSIDKNLTQEKAEELFDYLEETKAIERWAEDLGKPIELKENSSLTEYLTFWKNLKNTYLTFRQELLKQNKAYSGLVYRRVYNKLEDIINEQQIEHVAFVGFNQLTVVEIDIINRLIRMNKAETYWDADNYYMRKQHHEAGYYIRKHQNRWLPEIENTYKNYISSRKREVEIVSITGHVNQTKWLGSWLQEELKKFNPKTIRDHFSKKVNKIGILLPDETLLMPLLHSMPEKLPNGEPLADYINVTMGVSMHNTPLFDLFKAVFKMQDNLRTDKDSGLQIYHKDLLKILKHPLILFSPEGNKQKDEIYQVIKSVQENNIVYYPLERLKEKLPQPEMFNTIFKSWHGETDTAIKYFFKLTELLAITLNERKNRWETEYLYQFYKILNNLDELLSNQEEKITIKTFRQFLFEIIRGISVPFTGEPISPIQIMGMLESRVLDFEEVVILSCNEKILPKGKLVDSVIPFDLRMKYGLPTHKENDASFAYTFYRLFHRAKKIILVYANPTGDSGERSRFVMQVEEELKNLKNIQISHKNIVLENPISDNFIKEVPKTQAILKKVKEKLQRGVSPSTINNYITNPLAFLHSNVFGLEDPLLVEESLDARTFGTLLHEVLDKQLQPRIGKNVSVAFLEKLIKDQKGTASLMEEVIEEHFGEIETNRGKSYLLKEVAKKLLIDFYNLQIKNEANFFLVEQEQFQSHIIEVKLPNGENIPFKLTGKADRIDIIGNTIRVVDYKTGTYNRTKLKADDRTKLLLDPERGKMIQLLLYKYLLIISIEKGEVSNLPKDFNLNVYQVKSGFFFFRKLTDGFVEYQLSNEPKEIPEFKKYVEEFISALTIDILDDEKPFTEQPSGFELVLDILE